MAAQARSRTFVSNLPEKPDQPQSERTLSSRDFEMVIRRAAELQAREADESGGGDAMSSAEVLRIGRELGLSTRHLHQAMAEVGDSGTRESGLLSRLFGPVQVRVGRTVPGSPSDVSRLLEAYLIEREYLSVLRRLPDRVLLTRASGVIAAVGRVTSRIHSRSRPLSLSNLEMSVRALEDGYSYVTLASSLGGQRTGTAVASIVGGGWGAGALAAFLGIAIAPPVALAALPVFGGALYGGHRYYETVVHDVEQQLESLLDRLQHGELPPPLPRGAFVGPPRR